MDELIDHGERPLIDLAQLDGLVGERRKGRVVHDGENGGVVAGGIGRIGGRSGEMIDFVVGVWLDVWVGWA